MIYSRRPRNSCSRMAEQIYERGPVHLITPGLDIPPAEPRLVSRPTLITRVRERTEKFARAEGVGSSAGSHPVRAIRSELKLRSRRGGTKRRPGGSGGGRGSHLVFSVYRPCRRRLRSSWARFYGARSLALLDSPPHARILIDASVFASYRPTSSETRRIGSDLRDLNYFEREG